MNRKTPLIVYLLRKTSLSLHEIKALKLAQLREIHDEVVFQENSERYETLTNVAHILAAIANTVPRKERKGFTVKDFLKAKPPRRLGEKAEIDTGEEIKELAKRFGIKLPTKEIRELEE